ncbi:Protein FANTASTIC FOUR like [Quillaja saponaria]|uniref:Protein FANTASTIC FOUR like n=1 Tax=Quillaja saponaria TaxID=32244 RepID=A0AAD7QAP0_QUISA|nr:Protein FANTASTIC FOUR like [Quillaja saponaria]
MMSFCKKSVHSFLGFTTTTTTSSTTTTTENFSFKSYHHHQYISSAVGGLGLITITDDVEKKPSNILESAAVKPTPPSSPTTKKDPGGIGFIDDIGGGVDGLMSCTESLGFESSDERRVDDQLDEIIVNKNDNRNVEDGGINCWRRTTKTAEPKSAKWRDQVKKFPPPISSLNENGKPSFFLLPVRKDGRLELTEVRIHRPEILRASREDGRLILHLIPDDQDDILEEEEEEVEEEIEEEEEERIGEFWKFPAVNGDGLRRCHELVNQHHNQYHHSNHHHHHHLHVWSQPHCVTTR